VNCCGELPHDSELLESMGDHRRQYAPQGHEMIGHVSYRVMCSYSGVLFCVGGRGASGTPFKTIECYDPRKDLWIHVVEMSTRRRHVGVVAVGGQLLMTFLPVN
jgi:Kelch motif